MSVTTPIYLNNQRSPALPVSLPAWVSWLFVFTVFSRELGKTTIAGIDYDLISYNFFILYLIAQLRHLFISQRIMILLFSLMIIGLLTKLYLHLEIGPLWKQIIPIGLIYLASYDAFCRVGPKQLFSIYFQLSYYTAIFGLIQFAVKLFTGIKLMTGYSQLFVDSIAEEPSHYAVIVLPAVTYGLFYFRAHKKESAILLAALLLTTSSTAYMVLLVLLLIIYRKFQYLLLTLPVLYFVFTNILLSYDRFYSRYIGFANYFEKQNFKTIQSATSISFLSNTEAAIASIKSNPFFGSGLGGHEEMYKKHFMQSPFRFSYLYGLNSASAHSLLIRILSETGLVGFFLYVAGLWKSLLLKADDYHRIISIACLSHFIGKALKLGGYFDYGTPFFAMMLLFNFWSWKQQVKAKNEG